MFEEFSNRGDASSAAAELIANAVTRRLDAADQATLVVSGGSSPLAVFEELASRELSWHRLHVVPSDERWVPESHADSNVAMIRQRLLVGPAQDGHLLDVYLGGDCTPEDGARRFDERVRTLPFPYACALLGMGEDGHFASLFPDATALQSGLDVDGDRHALPIETAASPHARITLTLASLSRSDQIVLLIFGDKKREVYERAAQALSDELPISHLLRQKRAPLRICWAP